MEGELSDWLEAQCRAVPGVSRGLVVLGKTPQGPFTTAAKWPAGSEVAPIELLGACQIAISTERPALRGTTCKPGDVAPEVVAVPIFEEGTLKGAVALRVESHETRPTRDLADFLERALQDLKLAEPAVQSKPAPAPAIEPARTPKPAPTPPPEPVRTTQASPTPTLEPARTPKPAPTPPPEPARAPANPTAPQPTRPQPAPTGDTASLSPAPRPDPARALLDLAVAAFDCAEFHEAAISLTTELATRLHCERVSLGFVDGGEIELAALSHSARFDPNTKLARDIVAAMEEAVDQEVVVAHPPLTPDALEVDSAHAALCSAHDAAAACTVPLVDGDEIVGALSFEQSRGRTRQRFDLAFATQAAALLGPILNLKRREARPLWRVVRDTLGDAARDWLDAERPGRRWLAGAVALLTLLLFVIPGTHRVSAPATLGGTVQRAIVSPIDGYIAESRARAGDVVKRGDVLGALDDTDLKLERRKWAGQRSQLEKEHRAAGAENDRTQLRILRARLDQADAEIALIDGKLARTQLRVPFDGVVAKGDLSQALGSPVKRGDVLFEVAPLDSYRIVLEVDEREIANVAPGQHGELTLSALPGRALPLRVERITPVATAEGGRNFFRVEAALTQPPATLRPGMEGVGKIDIGPRALIWLWTHRLVDWLQLAAWSWLP
jgi:RND family efflux transporter MFP subunit